MYAWFSLTSCFPFDDISNYPSVVFVLQYRNEKIISCVLHLMYQISNKVYIRNIQFVIFVG